MKIIKGFFDEELQKEPLRDIKKVSFAFVDCDIYESASQVFEFLKPRMENGGFIMIDDLQVSMKIKIQYLNHFLKIIKSMKKFLLLVIIQMELCLDI